MPHDPQAALCVLPARTVRLRIIAAALVTAMVALPAGVIVGMRMGYGVPPVSPGHGSAARQEFVVAQLGRLDASVEQLEPRMMRLAAQVGQLRSFEARLARTPAASSGGAAPGTGLPGDGEGGPQLPPRHCVAPASRRASASVLGEETGCIAATLAALEAQTAQYAAAWSTYPGRMPVLDARAGSPFGNRIDPFSHRLAFHPGMDLVAPGGTWIFASAGGRVAFAGTRPGYGNVVEIDHGHGFATRYAHALRIIVREGDIVLPGDHIADVGSTGRSTGAHLHFEVLVNGNPVDPAAYLALFGAPAHG